MPAAPSLIHSWMGPVDQARPYTRTVARSAKRQVVLPCLVLCGVIGLISKYF